VFSLPIDGETDIPANSRFVVQFSKDMDEGTFERRVVLRYAGPARTNERGFPGMSVRYDGGRRALAVDPGGPLRAGRQVELILLPGILDTDGLALIPRSNQTVEGLADVLRFGVGY
jgi:hypothetical protein